MNILRDAAHLQTQLRQFDGLVDTRHTLLKIRPNLRSNWIGLAVAYHLNGNLPETKKTLEHYETILKVCQLVSGVAVGSNATRITRTSQITTSSILRCSCIIYASSRTSASTERR